MIDNSSKISFIESICCLDREALLLDYHQDRVNHTFAHFFPEVDPLILEHIVKDIPIAGKHKCRIVYSDKDYTIEYQHYQYRKIASLKLIETNNLDYAFKYLDRTALDHLYDLKAEADDIIIVNNGLVTDSYFANLAFFDGAKWWTPDAPLLKGVRRQYLLDQGIIKEKKITPSDLSKYQRVSLINAMLDLGEVEVAVPNVLH